MVEVVAVVAVVVGRVGAEASETAAVLAAVANDRKSSHSQTHIDASDISAGVERSSGHRQSPSSPRLESQLETWPYPMPPSLARIRSYKDARVSLNSHQYPSTV